MHPIWFGQWLWERALSNDGLAPLLERNQGLLSLAALGLALLALWIETRRANKAQAEATEAERQRAETTRAAEADRRQYELEAQRRQAELASEAEIERQLHHMAGFVRAANGILIRVQHVISDEINATLACVSKDGMTLYPSDETRKAAMVGAQSLVAIIPAAPLDPDLITDVRRIASDLEWLGGEAHGVFGTTEAPAYLRQLLEKLVNAVGDLTQHNIALTSRLHRTARHDLQAFMPADLWPSTEQSTPRDASLTAANEFDPRPTI